MRRTLIAVSATLGAHAERNAGGDIIVARFRNWVLLRVVKRRAGLPVAEAART